MDEERIREIVREELEAAGLKRLSREQVSVLIDQIYQASKDGKHVIVRAE